jgi:lauroyl/myristoyl acyltransferase
MEVLRHIRKRLTCGALRLGMEVSQRTDSRHVVEALRAVLLAFGRTAVPVRRRLAHNMKIAGVYRKELIDAYFARAVDQLVMLGHVLRTGFPNSGCPEKFKFDGSFHMLEQAYAAGKGVINIAPHICGYPVYGAVVSSRIPCSIYLRRNTDPNKMRMTEAVGIAGNGHLVAPPPGATKAQRLKVALDVLRQGKMLFITPDTPRKPTEGVRVTVFDRTVHFPTGVFVMSLRTGAPVVPVVWHWNGNAYGLRYGEPIELSRGGGMKEKAERAMRHWAATVDAFLRGHPEMWWNWLDKRWTRIIRSNGQSL